MTATKTRNQTRNSNTKLSKNQHYNCIRKVKKHELGVVRINRNRLIVFKLKKCLLTELSAYQHRQPELAGEYQPHHADSEVHTPAEPLLLCHVLRQHVQASF